MTWQLAGTTGFTWKKGMWVVLGRFHSAVSPLDSEKYFTVDTSKGWTLCIFFSPALLPDDDHWVVDTDYDNYAIHYSCRLQDSDGTCIDSYSLIFSRHPTGLRPEDQAIVTQKKADVCLLGKYRRVAHTGELSSTKCSFVCIMIYWSVSFVSRCSIRWKTKRMIDRTESLSSLHCRLLPKQWIY